MTVRFKNVPIPTFMLSQAESKIAFISRTGEVPMECPLLIKTLILRQLHCHQLAFTSLPESNVKKRKVLVDENKNWEVYHHKEEGLPDLMTVPQ